MPAAALGRPWHRAGATYSGAVPPRTSRRLNRDIIVEAALSVSRASDEGPGESPTGQALGRELGVDRSAIWRHFADKDDLLLTVADALSAETALALRGVTDPVETLQVVWTTVIAAFTRHPTIGCQIGERFVAGPNALQTTERVLGALSALGLNADEAALYYRVFIDITLACASTRARYLLLSEQERQADQLRTEMAIRALDHPDGAFATVNLDLLTRVDPAIVDNLTFQTFIAGVTERRHRRTDQPDRRD